MSSVLSIPDFLVDDQTNEGSLPIVKSISTDKYPSSNQEQVTATDYIDTGQQFADRAYPE